MKTNSYNPMTFFYVFIWYHVLKKIGNKFAVGGVKLPTVKTPNALAIWFIEKGIQYQADGIDGIKHWSTFLTDKGGDCDDFAEFSYLILSKAGYDCHRMYLTGSKESHVVLVCSKGRKFYIMDCNACYDDVKSYEDAFTYYEDYNKYLFI